MSAGNSSASGLNAPLFGNANGAAGGDPLFDYIGLDDVFGSMIFTPEGDMLDDSMDFIQPSLLPDTSVDNGGVAEVRRLSNVPQFGVLASEPVSWSSGGAAAAATNHQNIAPPGLQSRNRPKVEEAAVSEGAGEGGSNKKKRPMVGEVLTEEQKLERRERNREHAKRSRVRKKFLLESLQKSVDALQVENDSLKASIREHLGGEGEEIINTCCPPTQSLVTSNPMSANRILDDPDYSLVKALQTAQQNFVITDASLPDNPIVYASQGFLTLTGYTLDKVLGRNCRFLQGPTTDPRAVDKIRRAIERGEDTSVCLLNYRADGTTFWNQFFVAGLRDSDGKVVNYVGVQCRVSDEYASLVVQQQKKELERGTSKK